MSGIQQGIPLFRMSERRNGKSILFDTSFSISAPAQASVPVLYVGTSLYLLDSRRRVSHGKVCTSPGPGHNQFACDCFQSRRLDSNFRTTRIPSDLSIAWPG